MAAAAILPRMRQRGLINPRLLRRANSRIALVLRNQPAVPKLHIARRTLNQTSLVRRQTGAFLFPTRS